MDFRVIWSPSARLDLKEIVQYIAEEDPEAAEKIGHSLIDATKNLPRFPRKGRVVPEFGIDSLREVHLRPYRIVYRLLDEPRALEVVRIWHAARGTPEV